MLDSIKPEALVLGVDATVAHTAPAGRGRAYFEIVGGARGYVSLVGPSVAEITLFGDAYVGRLPFAPGDDVRVTHAGRPAVCARVTAYDVRARRLTITPRRTYTADDFLRAFDSLRAVLEGAADDQELDFVDVEDAADAVCCKLSADDYDFRGAVAALMTRTRPGTGRIYFK